MKPFKKIVRIGSRGSLLALAQAGQIQKELRKRNPRTVFKLVIIKTTGDEYQTVELFKKNNIGVFTKELERKLLSGEIDIAVHSLKDLPTDLPPGLILATYPRRLDTRDVLISKKRFTLKTLPKGAAVATGSPRRKQQLRLLRPDLNLFDIRGNLDTRIDRVLKKKDFHAVLLAHAGLLRLKKYLKYAVPVPAHQILPAVGQAALGLEARASDAITIKMLKKINHAPTEIRVSAERAFLKALHGGCRVPVGINSKIRNGKIYLEASVFSTQSKHSDGWRGVGTISPDRNGSGRTDSFDAVTGPVAAYDVHGVSSGPVKNYQKIAIELAKKLLSRGAGKLLLESRQGDAP